VNDGIEPVKCALVSECYRAQVLTVDVTVGKIDVFTEGTYQLPPYVFVTCHETTSTRITIIDIIAHDLHHVRDNALTAADSTSNRYQFHLSMPLDNVLDTVM